MDIYKKSKTERIKEDNIMKGVLVGYLEAFAFNHNILKPMNREEFNQFCVHFAFMVDKSFGVKFHKMFKDVNIDAINEFLRTNNFHYKINERFNEETGLNEYKVIHNSDDAFKQIDSIFKPYIVTLIGSSKFMKEFDEVESKLTMEGKIVFTPSIFKAQKPLEELSEKEHEQYDSCHRRKIRMSNEVFVINPGGYIGEDTLEEKRFAEDLDIPISYLVDPKVTVDIISEGPIKLSYNPCKCIKKNWECCNNCERGDDK